MTFCLGLKSADGLLALADTRLTSGTEISQAPKIAIHDIDGYPLFILTSGLRSLRDKVVTYFARDIVDPEYRITRTYEATNALARQLRTVRIEDSQWLSNSGLIFDLHCIVGGRLSNDSKPQMFLVFPEGNWVEVNAATPYVIIGDNRYGKPLLDQIWRFERSLNDGLLAGLLAFAHTKTSASNVDYPLDVIMLQNGSNEVDEIRVSRQEGAQVEQEWNAAMDIATRSVRHRTDRLFQRLQSAPQEPEPLLEQQQAQQQQ